MRAIGELSARSLQNGLMTGLWRRRDGHASGPTLVSVLPSELPPTSAPDPEPPPVVGPTHPVPWTPGPPPPPNPVGRRSPALALGLVCTLMLTVAAGSLGISRAIANALPAGFPANGPAVFPAASPPVQPTSPGVVSMATLQAVLSATPATRGVTVDPALAARIVGTVWPVREAALDSDDPTTLAGFETGSALAGDNAELAASACGCTGRPARPIATRNLFVPKESAYPAWFVTELTTSPVQHSQSDVLLMVFTRASALAHWMLSLETEYAFGNGSAWVYATPESMPGGYDLATSRHNELPVDLGAYYQSWADQGVAPPTSPFAPGAFTTALGQLQAAEDKTLAAEGEQHRVTYSVDEAQDGNWTVAANNERQEPSYGWALSCGTVRYVAVTTLAPGAAPILQPADRSTWGATLAPGTYTRITQWGLHETCFMDDLDGIPYLVLGHEGGVIRSTGVPAKPK